MSIDSVQQHYEGQTNVSFVSEGVCKVLSGRLRRALSKNALYPVKLLLKRNEMNFTYTLSKADRPRRI